jgi:two-component system, chemotaxis family, response regulator Rcp1
MRPIEILLVEDNLGDIRLTLDAFKDARVANVIHVVKDGAAAMSYLLQTGDYVDAVRPDIVLLDLNLPKKNGREVLQEIKTNEQLKRIPVVILTTSEAEEDIDMAYGQHANCFIRKPVDFHAFMEIIKQIETFWLTIVRLPHV